MMMLMIVLLVALFISLSKCDFHTRGIFRSPSFGILMDALSTLVTRSNPLGFVNITVIVVDHDSWSL